MMTFHGAPPRIGCWILLCLALAGCGSQNNLDQPAYTGSKLIVLPPYPGRDEEGETQFWEVTAYGLAELSEIDGAPAYVLIPAPESLEYDRCRISVRDPINSVVYFDNVEADLLEQRPVFQFKAKGSAIVPPATRVAVVAHFWSDAQPQRPHWMEGIVIVVSPIAKYPQATAAEPNQ